MLLTMLTGCDPFDEGSASGTSPAPARAETAVKKGGCNQAGEHMRHWLPKFGTTKEEVTIKPVVTNPCLPLSGLSDQVSKLEPRKDELKGSKAAVKNIASQVTRVAGYYTTVADTTKCLYEADALVIGVYQHEDHPWSVGVVVAVGRDLKAGAKAVLCYLTGQSAILNGPSLNAPPTDIGIQICADPLLPDESRVVVLRFGTSNWMCSALDRAVPRV